MNKRILDIDKDLQDYRSSLGTLLVQISQLSAKTSNNELIKNVDALKYNIDKPFMFVVMGDVKAGKSSFVNALLEVEVCATNVRICTDKIQVIYYSETEFRNEINNHLAEIGKPIEILKEISIVDTPGTNSVIENHQIITKEFIPSCDLAFFVLFAKNPFLASTWSFLDYVSSKWHKKIVLILQQADLLSSEELLDIISEVKNLAEKKGIKAPIVFSTSAKLELEGDANNSGFSEVRNYIKNLITNKETYKLKLKNITNTVKEIIDGLGNDIGTLKQRLDSDRIAVNRVKNRFDYGRKQSLNEVELTGNRVADRYSIISQQIEEEFRKELSFVSVVKRTLTLSLKQRLEYFSERCRSKLQSEIEEIAQERASHILDGIRQFGEDLKQDLDTIPTHQIEYGRFQIKVLERRSDLLDNLKRKVENFLDSEDWVQSLNTGIEGAVLGTGGAFAVLTVVVAQIIELVLANFALAAFEVAFAGIGILIFVIGFAWRRSTIIKKFEQALDDGKSKLEDAITQRLNEKLSIIYDDLERECSRFYNDVEQEEKEIVPLLDSYSDIQTNFEKLFSKVPTVLD